MTEFLDLLKKKCQKCTKSSLKAYLQHVRRLYRLQFEGAVPTNGKWLSNDALFKKFKAVPVNKRRHLSLGAVKAMQSYGMDTKKTRWYKAMMADQQEYVDMRAKHEKTDVEKKNWISTRDLKKAARDLKRRFRHILDATPTLANLYKVQWWLVIKLFTTIPVRNDFATLRLKKTDDGNYVVRPRKGSFTFVFQQYKNSDKLGDREIKLNRAATMAVRRYLKYRSGVELDHDYLLTSRTGKPLTTAAFGKALRGQTSQLLGKRVGSRQIRVTHASENREILEKAAELSNKFLHSEKRTLDYVRKD